MAKLDHISLCTIITYLVHSQKCYPTVVRGIEHYITFGIFLINFMYCTYPRHPLIKFAAQCLLLFLRFMTDDTSLSLEVQFLHPSHYAGKDSSHSS